MRNKRALLAIVTLALGGFLFAASPYASIVYAEGSTFTLIRSGKSTTVRVDDPATIGMEIKAGDILSTGKSTFLEISVNPVSASIQVAENTSFRCDADPTGNKASGELYYGRVRAKVAKLSGDSSFRLSSPSLTAGVRGTDFGLDVIAVRPGADKAVAGSTPTLYRVFCFEGSVIVGSAQGTIADTILLGNNEMVERVVAQGTAKADEGALERKRVSTDVVDFWKVHPFAVISRLPKPVGPVVGTASAATGPSGVKYAEPVKRLNTRFPQAGAIALVGIGTVACAAAAYWSVAKDPDARFIDPAYAAGTIMIGSGTVLALVSLLADR